MAVKKNMNGQDRFLAAIKTYVQGQIIKWKENLILAIRYLHLFRKRKIIYALTPPEWLPNVGDHAQVIAIRAWFAKHFPGMPVLEFDKGQSTRLMPFLRRFIRPSDIIFLHSGGNLGDRGKRSERARRAIIASFSANRIISLPQTIYFSDTQDGRKEKQLSMEIYNKHPNLTVMGRDPQSTRLAAELFPHARTFSVPDFVLSFNKKYCHRRNSPPTILLCLRTDNESNLNESARLELVQRIPYQTTRYDTTLDHPFGPKDRERILEKALSLFAAHDAVVTDRYHGVIFAVLCGKPTVVLQTVDHKLTSAIEWFRDLPQICMADNPAQVAEVLEQVLLVENIRTIDWNAIYFDRLPEMLGFSKLDYRR